MAPTGALPNAGASVFPYTPNSNQDSDDPPPMQNWKQHASIFDGMTGAFTIH
jgi:hypothetical protein